jgi:peptide deformylase
MDIHAITKKCEATLATIVSEADWVNSKAEEIDLEAQFHLAVILDRIMRYFRQQHFFAGISSNNIFWKLTPKPIRAMLIPGEKKYIILINPKIVKLAGHDVQSVEGCGSIPDVSYVVKRKPFVAVSGYTLKKEHVELAYGSENYVADKEPVFASFNTKEWIVQHEMDHLDGITIKDKGTPFDFSSLMPKPDA